MNKSGKKIIFIAILFALVSIIVFFAVKKINYNFTFQYQGTVGDVKVFLSLSEPDRKISGKYFYASNKALAALESISIKQINENGYKITVHHDGKRLKGNFSGIICPDSIIGDIVLNERTAGLLNIPVKPALKVRLIKEIPHVVPQPDYRYEKPVFDSVVRSEGIRYGTASGYYTEYAIDKTEKISYARILTKDIFELLMKEELDLYLDFYQPYQDTLSQRPVILLLHGGAFVAGDRKTPTILKLSEYLCRLGYTVASADYRLGFNPLIRESLERCSYRAVQDARAALRYLVRYAPDFGIDTSNIFIGGTSAGSITALYTAYLEEHEKFSSISGNSFFYWSDLGCLDCSGNDIERSFNIKGVINMWGAIHDTAIIDPGDNIPLISFHGTSDNIVPFGYDYPFRNINNFFTRALLMKMFGSGSLHDHTEKAGISNFLVPFKGYDHEPQISEGGFNHNLETILERSRDFLYSNMLPEMMMEGLPLLYPDDPLPIYKLPYIHGCKYFWEARGGKVLSSGLYNHETNILWTKTGMNNVKVLAITPAGVRVIAEMPVEVKGK